jgi:hypothetical protein
MCTSDDQEDGDAIVAKLSWIVMEDRKVYESAGVDDIRRYGNVLAHSPLQKLTLYSYFRTRIESEGKDEGSGTRYEACILADDAVVDSVLSALLDSSESDLSEYMVLVDALYAPEQLRW